jgi:hypothetical protein
MVKRFPPKRENPPRRASVVLQDPAVPNNKDAEKIKQKAAIWYKRPHHAVLQQNFTRLPKA